ncbi:MAG: alpha/beta fold hydrolase [Pseudorhodoplanes sp.]
MNVAPADTSTTSASHATLEAMNAVTHRRTTLSPCLTVDVAGKGADQSEALVFLHGIGGNRTNWASQLADLSDAWRCVAFDFRGYGGSDDVAGALDFFDFTDDVARALDELAIARCHLFGLSMGGLVAQAFYARHPDRVLSLGIIGSRPGSAPVFEDSQRFAEERAKPLEQGAAALADSLLPRLLGPAVTPEARTEIRESLARLRPASYKKVLAARLSIAPFLELSSIAVPTLVVAGTHDQVAPLAQMKAIAAAIPGSVLEIMPEAGHLMNIEQPDRFNTAVRNFLNSIKRQSAV